MPTLVLRDANVQATRIVKHNPASNFSGDASLFLEAVSTTNQARLLLKFADLVPPGGVVTVSNATLAFTNADAVGATKGVEVRKFVQPWTLAQATWNSRATATPWAVAGALGGAEVDASVLATGTAPTAANAAMTLTGAGLIAYAQSVLNGAADHGMLVNLLDDATVWDGIARRFRGPTFATVAQRPTFTIEYTVGVVTPPNWTVSNPTVNSDAGTATVVLTLDAPAGAGGVNGFFDTYDITAAAGADYTARTAVPISIAEGGTTANLTVTIIP